MAGNTPAHTGFVNRIKGKEVRAAGSSDKFGGSANLMEASGNMYTNYSATGFLTASDTSEDTLDSYSLAQNALNFPGRTLQIQAWGYFGANTHSKAVKLYFGSESITITGYTTSITGGTPWFLEMTVGNTGSNKQAIMAQSITGAAHNGVTQQVGSETTSNAITIKVTGQTGTASTTDVIMMGWMIQGFN